MKIPLLDLKSQYQSIKDEIDTAINGVLQSQQFVLGEELETLEKEIADFCMVRYGVGVASGTDALFLSLKALGIGEGDEVITTPLTFIATGEAISNLGARPVFVDIDKKTYNINPALIEQKITEKTKAVLPVHLYGQCADIDPILKLAREYGLKVIEDCAQAIGALYKGRRAGSLGDVGCISFFPSKNLGAFGDGGMVVTNDEGLAEEIKVLRVHGSSSRYSHDALGYNSRLDNLQAAVLRVKLRSLDGWIDTRNRLADVYTSALSGLDLTTPFLPEYNTHTYHLYTILSPRRDELLKHLLSSDIEARVYYPVPLHLQKCYTDLGYKKGDLPVSEWISENILAIPLYPELKNEGVQTVANCIKEFCERDQDTALPFGRQGASERHSRHKTR
ncbi:DegT/DnrJ/EryC1/StrS family aminotransferase [Omnitrophica bacterium]|nr:DegT/DnrJ/EryC1/StrS family aminotransferase [Candidatus Omnitrophota bacterium]